MKGSPFETGWKQAFSVGFPGGSDSKESACSMGDPGLIPGLGRSPGEGNSNLPQYSFLEIPWTEEPGGLQSMKLHHKELDMTEQLTHVFSLLVKCKHLNENEKTIC